MTNNNQFKQNTVLTDYLQEAVKNKRLKANVLINPDNMLYQLHTILNDMPVLFKNRVIAECGLSIPTYYRYMKPTRKKVGNKQIWTDCNLSNAEKAMIRRVFDDIFKVLTEYYTAFQKSEEK